MNTKLSIGAVALLAASGAAWGVACSSTNTNPMPDGGAGGSTIVTASASSGSGSPTASASSGGGGMGGATTAASSSSGGVGGGSNCYDGGAPMMTNDFLNPCATGMTCQAFPNSTLPGLTADGGLPPLQ